MKTYDPKQVFITFGGRTIGGFADGSFLKVERDEDAYSLTVGADGIGTRARIQNRAGKITLTLQRASDDNAILQGFAAADEASNSGVVPFFMKDNLGGDSHQATNAWIEKQPSVDYSKENTNLEWVIRTDLLISVFGGVEG